MQAERLSHTLASSNGATAYTQLPALSASQLIRHAACQAPIIPSSFCSNGTSAQSFLSLRIPIRHLILAGYSLTIE